jgi:hypothetical protein
MAYKGKFKPKYPEKYKGDPTNIIYRSMWEMRFMRYLDSHPSVINWASEEVIIPYISPIDKRVHRYFPDFWVKMKSENGTINTVIIEIKPHKQTKIPQRPEKLTRRFINEARTYSVNSAKWKAAQEFCNSRNWEFKVLTEKELGLNII